ncbi:hypothetical protein 16Q_034c [Pseudomonas phage 16Q]|nr:hypothetical protein 16Q_034c [Pseudomonas phage 16Q]
MNYTQDFCTHCTSLLQTANSYSKQVYHYWLTGYCSIDISFRYIPYVKFVIQSPLISMG